MRNSRRIPIFVLVAALMPSLSSPASACSVGGILDARRLAANADSVVLVRVIGNEVQDCGTRPVLDVIELFKGSIAGDTFTIAGSVQYRDAQETAPAEIYPHAEPPYDRHPESAGMVSCYPSERYLLYGYYLLYLKNGSVRWAPLAATNARVSGRDDAWVAWVREEFRRKP